jgi:hypothetical protein
LAASTNDSGLFTPNVERSNPERREQANGIGVDDFHFVGQEIAIFTRLTQKMFFLGACVLWESCLL